MPYDPQKLREAALGGATTATTQTVNNDRIQQLRQAAFGQTPDSQVAEQPQKEDVGFFKGLARGVASPFLRVGVTGTRAVKGLGQLIGGNRAGASDTLSSRPTDLGFFGKIKPIGQGAEEEIGLKSSLKTALDAGGVGVELGSYGVGFPGAKQVGKSVLSGLVKQGAKEGFKTGVASGLVGGVGMGMQGEDATVGSIAKSGFYGLLAGGSLGTILGGSLPVAGKAVNYAGTGLNRLIQNKVPRLAESPFIRKTIGKIDDNLVKQKIGELEDSYNDVFVGKVKTQKMLTKEQKTGKDTAKFLAEHGDIVDTDKQGNIIAKPAIDRISTRVNELLEPTHKAIVQEYTSKNPYEKFNILDILKSAYKKLESKYAGQGSVEAMKNKLQETALNAAKEVGSQDGYLNMAQLDKFREAQWAKSNTFNILDEFKGDISYYLGKTARDLEVSKLPKESGELLKYIGDHLQAIKILNAANGKVKGGRLGKYSMRWMGMAALNQFGLPGNMAGMFAGDIMNNIMLSNAISTPVKRAILNQLPKGSPVYDAAINALSKIQKQGINTPALLPPPTKTLFTPNVPESSMGIRGEPNVIYAAPPQGRSILPKPYISPTFKGKPIKDMRVSDIAEKNPKSTLGQFLKSTGKKVKDYANQETNIGLAVKDVSKNKLTTKFLSYIDDKLSKNPNATLSRQEIMDFAKRPELKKGEADLLLKKLEEFEPKKVGDYAMSHRPSKTGAIASDISKGGEVIPTDVYDHPEWYANMKEKTYRESFDVLKKIRGNPEAEITIYRASPKKEFNVGDWVTLSKTYAKEEALRVPVKKTYVTTGNKINKIYEDPVPVYSMKVKAKDIQFAGDDINEFGYYPEKSSKLPAQDFADSIRRDLLELKPVKVKPSYYRSYDANSGYPDVPASYPFENIRIKEGNPKNYEEVVFESPITTNGSSHFPNSENYFAHARGDEVVEGGKKIWREQEIQSDLLQKDVLDRQYDDVLPRLREAENHTKAGNVKTAERIRTEVAARQKELGSLDPFTNDRFGERIMRERIREKAQKGYSKYRLPTGETIGKIEGFEPREWNLGWKNRSQGIRGEMATAKNIETGKLVVDRGGNEWIITDVIGDGRFKAVPKHKLQEAINENGFAVEGGLGEKSVKYAETSIRGFERLKETFDLTGKSNPQYRRYEQWGKFLKNKYGGKLITDKQGNNWYEIDLKPEYKTSNIEAFGLVAGGVGLSKFLGRNKKEKN